MASPRFTEPRLRRFLATITAICGRVENLMLQNVSDANALVNEPKYSRLWASFCCDIYATGFRNATRRAFPRFPIGMGGGISGHPLAPGGWNDRDLKTCF